MPLSWSSESSGFVGVPACAGVWVDVAGEFVRAAVLSLFFCVLLIVAAP
jgi:hypothetical protein